MFTSLHALAKRAPLMITIAPEGADQLRVNVMPVPTDTEAGATLPQPLSLLATPAEFDADFITALATWQAPRRSLVQQAEDAAGTGELAAPAAAPKQAAKQDKGARKASARGAKPAAGEPESPALQAAGEAAGEAAAAADLVMADSKHGGADQPHDHAPAPDLASEPADAPEPVDTFTLELF